MIEEGFDYDIGYWQLGANSEHINNTGPIYSGMVNTLYYNRGNNSIETRDESYKFWGVNFGSFNPDEYVNESISLNEPILENCAKDTFNFTFDKIRIKVPFAMVASFSDNTMDTIYGTYRYYYYTNIKLSEEDKKWCQVN